MDVEISAEILPMWRRTIITHWYLLRFYIAQHLLALQNSPLWALII